MPPKAQAITAPVENDNEWETVDLGTRVQVTFDTIGDEFTGKYTGTEQITNPKDGEAWTSYLYEGIGVKADGVTDDAVKGLPCGIAAGWSLQQALNKRTPGEIHRIKYTRNTDTGQVSPMKEFRVDIRK